MKDQLITVEIKEIKPRGETRGNPRREKEITFNVERPRRGRRSPSPGRITFVNPRAR